jgi:dTDP-4-dehydrorhamnose 3,5-epimerase-like enzyme
MKKFNIFDNSSESLGDFKDDRGRITDLFFKVNLNHVALIDSKPNAIRGNHFHKQTIQHIYIISGSLEYWYKNSEMRESLFEICTPGDIITSNENEIHALRIGSDGCLFMAFTEGMRGGKDYELDTIRVPNIIGQ